MSHTLYTLKQTNKPWLLFCITPSWGPAGGMVPEHWLRTRQKESRPPSSPGQGPETNLAKLLFIRALLLGAQVHPAGLAHPTVQFSGPWSTLGGKATQGESCIQRVWACQQVDLTQGRTGLYLSEPRGSESLRIFPNCNIASQCFRTPWAWCLTPTIILISHLSWH